MLGKLVMELKGEDDKKHGYFMGTMMQGVLMESMEPSLAAALHKNERHPYSQYILNQNGRLEWTVCTAGADIRKQVFRTLLDPDFHDIKLVHRNEKLEVVSKNDFTISEEELVRQYYLGECSRYLELKFLTPTGFKQDGQYCIFPTVRLIMQSLMLKHDASSEESTVFSEEILEDLEKYCSIVRYHLKSTVYPVGNSKIPSFTGTIVIKVRGPQQMANFVRFLAEYGVYTGIGIKTGMGMGTFEIIGHDRGKETGKEDL